MPSPIRIRLGARKKSPRRSPKKKQRMARNLSPWRSALRSHRVGETFAFRRSDGSKGRYKKTSTHFAKKV